MTKYIIILLLLSYSGAYAQTDTSIVKPKPVRSDYIQDLTNYINITPFIHNAANGFELRAKKNLRYDPNESIGIGLRMAHKWLILAVGYGPKNIQEKKRGSTDYLNITLNSYGKRFGFDAYYLAYTGYYISNPAGIPNLGTFYGKDFPILPDLSTLNVGCNVFYIFNNQKYSYRAPFVQNELQKRSAGSFILTASYSYYRLKSDTGIVPALAFSEIPPESRITEGSFNSISIMPGYSFTLVGFKRLFFTLSPSLGIMAQQQSYLIDNTPGTRSVIDVVPRAMSRFAFGYNGKRFYTGFTSIIDTYNVPLANKDFLMYTIGGGSFYIGYRITVPQSLQKASDKLEYYNPKNVFQRLKS
ncbi:MAG: DUF4421 family protein [Bacteroidota bacterium]